ncbi:MAG TPA: hypothetical protein VKR83_04715, partial [Ktedonobacteraceae bacterium]|nr:hypothetical protein [Ktedonobacteraceae bacterium]
MKLFGDRISRTIENFNAAQLMPAIPYFVSLCITLLGGALLFRDTVISSMVSFIIGLGLDPQRAQLTAALTMTMFAAGIGGLLGRQRWISVIGGGIIFLSGYLVGFIQLQLRPVYDPGGHLEVLDVGALIHTSSMLIALGLLSAFIGAALGMALSEALFDPFLSLMRLKWRPMEHFELQNDQNVSQGRGEPRLASWFSFSWLGTIIMIALLILASGSSDIFLYAPDTGLHTLPSILSNDSKLPTHSTITQDSLISPALNGQKRNFLVYLPPSYNTPQGQTKRYPTLYLLHGSPGSDVDWFNAGKA